MIDLHTHSTMSDGTLSPSSIIQAAENEGLAAIALTDHDTVEGVPEFLRAGNEFSGEAVAGVEIACAWYGGSMHLLGLFIDWQRGELLELLEEIQDNRKKRNTLILEKLDALDMPVSLAAVEAERALSGGVIGRPHFARALVEAKYCSSMREAFQKFLGRGGRAYVSRFLPLPDAALKAIHHAGGVAVLAHPFGGIKHARAGWLRQKLQKLRSLGLDGLEVYYSDHTEFQEKTALQLASELGLLTSGGSDFHGDNMAGNSLGRGYGSLETPDLCLPPLRRAAANYTSRMIEGENTN